MSHLRPFALVLPLVLGALALGCGEPTPGKAIDPDEKKACTEVGNRVTVTGYLLASDVPFCGSDGECNGYLVSEPGSSTAGIPMKRLQATAPIGEGKSQVKAITPSGGVNWRSTSSHDAEGKQVSQPAKFSGKLKKMDDGCVLAIDRIDSLSASPAASAK